MIDCVLESDELTLVCCIKEEDEFFMSDSFTKTTKGLTLFEDGLLILKGGKMIKFEYPNKEYASVYALEMVNKFDTLKKNVPLLSTMDSNITYDIFTFID